LYTADSTQPGLFEGVVDTALVDNYRAILLVGNQMIQRGDVAAPRAESNHAHLEGAIVRVTDANGGDIAEFTSPAMGFANAANGIVANFGLMGAVLLDAPTITKLQGQIATGTSKLVLANIKVYGKTLGGVDLESGEFQMPIRVCSRCLVSFSGADDPLTPGIDCNLSNSTAGGATGGATETVGPCQFGQDEIVPCRICRDENPVCRTAADQ